jgi:8-oxo-dGTP pyrophosphatase MutT (NUDIX family)
LRIELGEAPAEAVVHEVWEETGLYVVPRKLLGVFDGKDSKMGAWHPSFLFVPLLGS